MDANSGASGNWYQMGLLNDALVKNAGQPNEDAFLESVCREARWLVPATRTSIFARHDASGDVWEYARARGGDVSIVRAACELPDDVTAAWPRSTPTWIEAEAEAEAAALLVAPMRSHDGHSGAIAYTFDRAPAKSDHAMLTPLAHAYSLHCGITWVLVRHRAKLRSLVDSLSTPLIRTERGVLVLPIVGVVDDARAQRMMEDVLDAVSKQHATHLVVDVTGIDRADALPVHMLMRMMNTVRLLGVEVVLCGVRPHLARSLVQLDVNPADLNPHADLQHALRGLRKPRSRERC